VTGCRFYLDRAVWSESSRETPQKLGRAREPVSIAWAKLNLPAGHRWWRTPRDEGSFRSQERTSATIAAPNWPRRRGSRWPGRTWRGGQCQADALLTSPQRSFMPAIVVLVSCAKSKRGSHQPPKTCMCRLSLSACASTRKELAALGSSFRPSTACFIQTKSWLLMSARC
jgi:hypothetical protein